MSDGLDTLLRQLENLGVRLWVEAGQLRFSAPKGVVQGSLRDALIGRKAELIARLSAPEEAREAVETAFPASANQETLWSLDRVETDCPSLYIEARAVRLNGELDVAALGSALNALCRRHDSLRTRLELRDGALCQIVSPALSVALPVEDATGLDPAALDERVNAVAWAPFALDRAPLLRLHLLRTGAQSWILVFSQHHVVTDRWSIALLVGELSALYAAFQAGRPSPLPPPAAQYGDYTRWQRDRLAGEWGEALLAYWRQALADAPPLLALPTDRPYPGRQSYRGGRITVPLDAGLRDGVEALCRREKATPFMVFTAAFTALLHRITGQETIVLGTPIANRLRPDLEAVPGYFVNTLALRTDVDGRAAFRDLLAGVRDTALAAYEHQELPFSLLVDALRPERGQPHPPVFQAMIVLQNVEMAELSLVGVALAPHPLRADTGKYPLLLTILPDEPGGPKLCWDFQSDLFDEATVAGIARRFTVLLADALAAPDRAVHALALLTPEDERALLRASNRTLSTVTPGDATIAALFAGQAAATPDAVALRFGERRVGYRALDRQAETLARRLREHGVGRGDPVGIALDRSPELIAGLLAILKLGAVYVPLDLRYPAERLAWMAEDSGIRLLVTDAAGAGGIGWTGVPRLVVEALPFAGDDAPAPLPDPGTDAGSPAYVMYTSGSTGRPKGVVVPQRGVVRLVRGADYARFGASEVMLLLAPVSFDASTLEIWGSLLNGGTLLIAPPLDDDLLALGRVVREGGVTTLWLTSGLFTLMVDTALDDLRGVRQLITGGEALSRRHAAEVLARLPDTTLVNGYGPTENTTFTACHRFPKGPAAVFPAGRPIAGTSVYVLDAHGNPVPPGVAGELLTGGDGLAIGYHNQPGLTAERFVTLDLALGGERWTERLYRTGDLARWVPDPATGGLVIDILGRIDRQVKIRGFRIEPGEVEAQLGALPGIADCAVVVRHDDGQPRLVAYWVPAASSPPPDPRAALVSRLPDYMVPSQFVALDALPVSPTGKTDRQALASDRFRVAPASGGEAPATPTETLLAELWAGVLDGGPVHRTTHFFERGGNSLSAIRMIARVREVLAAAGRSDDLPVRSVFEHPTLAALATVIDRAETGTGEEDAGAPLSPRNLGRSGLPLSHAQERLWVLEKLLPTGGAYNVPGRYRIDGPLDADALEHALRTVVERHDTLSAVFTEQDGRGVQCIAPAGFRLSRQDCAAADLPRRLALEAEAPFDLERGPPIRATLFRTGPDAHCLQVVMHHLVCDGWSVAVFLREMETLYAGRSPLPPLPVQYQDYADWHREWLRGPRLERLLGYWRTKLDGLPDGLELPTDYPRPPVPGNRGATAVFTADVGMAAVDRLCHARGISRFMLFYAVFAALLHRVTGQADFGVGTPIAGRHHRKVEPLIGFFADTLVLRTPVEGDESVSALLGRARRTVLEAFDHQDLPFTALVEALKPSRRLDTAPLFQVMLAVEDEAPFALTLPGLTVEPVAWDSPFAKYDLTLTVQPSSGGVAGSLEYNTDLFHPDSAARLGRWFGTLLAAVLADPEQPVAAIDLRDAAERARPPGLAGAVHPRPIGVGLHDLIAEQARRTPAAPALSYGDATLSHGAVEAAANRLAHHLIARGLKPGGLVGVHRRRALDLPVILLAILKAGGAYVPLNPAHPAERIAAVLRAAKPALVVAGPGFPVADASVVLVDPDAEADAVAGRPGTPPDLPSDGDRLAYVMFTSGSTGTPKGVAVPHRAIVNHQLWFRRVFGLSSGDALVQMTSFDFDASVIEMFAPLLCGGRLVIAPPGGEKDPAQLRDLIRAGGITLFQAVPALLQVMVEEGLLAGCPTLRVVCSGGEALATALQDRLMAQVAPARVFNLYGPTETCIDAAFHEGRPGLRQATVPIGRPVDNLRAYALDGDLRPVPDGMPGELFLAGGSLAAGYLNEPALTEAAFLPDPFAGGDARMYRTGDRVRLGPEGLEFLGRLDRQVKLRGFRIETAEIEAALNAAPSVRESAVVGVRRPGDTEHRLVAFVAGAGAEGNALRAALKRTLPDYMVPAHFVALDALPLASSGKIDRRRLEAMAETALADARAPTDRIPPRTDDERALAAIWREVLKTDALGVHDNFFDLGGHSLMAVQVVARIRARWPVALSVRHVFEAPTIVELAAELALLTEQDGAAAARPPLVALPRKLEADGAALMPVSYSQRSLWFLDRLEGGGRAYTTVGAFVLTGALEVPALVRALDALMARHEALRTGFVLRDEEPWQRILPPLPLPFSRTSAAGADDDAALAELALAEAARPIDLSREPPLRFALIELARGRHLGVLTWHHIASDGWSLGVFVREICALYAAAVTGRDAALPPLPLQYGDYADWQGRWLSSPGFAAQLDYWKRQLGDAPPHLNLCTDRPRPHRQSFHGATLRFRVEPALTRKLLAVGQAAQASLFMTLLAVFMVLLHRHSRQDDVLVGTPVANRPAAELEGLIGFFTNTLVLRGRMAGNPRFADFLDAVRRTALDAFANPDVPFEKLVDALDPPRSLSHAPLFQAMFNLQNTPVEPVDLPGLTLAPLEIDTRTAKFDLLLSLIETDGGLEGHWEYSSDLFDPQTAQRMADHYVALLRAVAEEPDRRLRELPLFPEAERDRLLAACRGPARTPGGDGTLHRLFEETAARTPDAVAVEFDGRSLTYDRLNRWSNALARRLIALGVTPDDAVGIRLERSLEMVAAVLGILKAGGAYAPLDPALPAARLAFIVENAGLALVVGGAPDGNAPDGGLPHGAQAVPVGPVEDGGDNPAPALAPEHLAYVLHTSGSTGQPKGVLMPHRALVNLIRWQVAEPGFAPGLRTLQFTTLGFDVACQEMFATWASGGTLVLMDEALRRDVPSMIARAAEWGIQRIFLPFTALQQMAEAWPLASARPADLRELITAGERLKVTPALRRMFRALPGARLVNQYGPTETHVATALALPANPDSWPELPRIGRPVANTAVYILDEEGRPLPPGVPGQLWIAGTAVARGYLNRPDLTDAAFRPDPFGGGMMYATGDLACLRWDAGSDAPEIDFLGRIDQQVKVRGYRIEPEEVERALVAQARAREAAVVAWSDGSGENRLVAYYVPADPEAGDPRVLRDGLAAALPDYMIPTLWVPLPALPQTRSGKVDRKALPPPDTAAAKGRTAIAAAPGTATERVLAGIWQAVLQGPPVGLHDNFFDLGGYSFLLLKVLGEIRRRFPEAGHVAMVSLFEHPTVHSLARLIDGTSGGTLGGTPGRTPGGTPGASPIRHRAAARRTLADTRDQRRDRRTALRHGGAADIPDREESTR
ncbi:non-ribosomal peptide synthetase [Azospirillum doebereinerae]|uniref:Amino acid adenylation domain-containing protein n=1 Tax=Azospirillum doebereinerae TaxID=92933 RepID=A0A433J7R0_9PROT|nr:non-ribosomal peptide synthetase [Azospirillum doebereinerae]RUQ69734.1 amino acid adenylation domain-containing protein [Azospirillum doebereinerae]